MMGQSRHNSLSVEDKESEDEERETEEEYWSRRPQHIDDEDFEVSEEHEQAEDDTIKCEDSGSGYDTDE